MAELNNAETIAQLARKAAPPQIVASKDGREFLIVPEGMAKHEIPNEHGLKNTSPSYLNQTVTLQAVDSLGDYVNRFKVDETMLFADIAQSKIEGVLDYHSATNDKQRPQPSRTTHRACLSLPFSEEWRLWSGISGQLKPQLEFARFIEENAPDIIAPSGGELLDAVRDLNAHRKVNFIKAVRTNSDNENFEFTDETEARTKGGLEIPTKFVLSIPVYFGESNVELGAFLRWKIDPEKGGLSLGIQLHRAEHVRQAVFKQIMLTVSDRTGCPVVFGKVNDAGRL